MKFQFILILTLGLFCEMASAGGKMVYLHQQGEVRQVALADWDGRGKTLLTPADKLTYHPEISSDGRFVAYSIGDDFQHMAIEIVDLETDIIEVWTKAADQYIHAEFSTDGRVLAFSGPLGKEGRQSIGLIDIEKERSKKKQSISADQQNRVVYQPEIEVIENQPECFFPAVSSDGSFIVFHCTHDENRKQLFLYNRDTGEQTPLTDPDGYAVAPSLSYDDRHVAYAGKVDGTWDIFIIDLIDGKTIQMTQTPQREFTPVFTPSGDLVYTHFSGEPMKLDLYKIQAGEWRNGPVEPVPFIAAGDVQEYIPSFSGDLSLQLTLFPPIPEPARSSFGAIRHQGKIFIAGGHQGPEHTYPKESFLDRLAIFDEQTRTWTTGAPLSVPRQGFEMAAHGPYIYAFGGFAFSEHHEPGWRSLDLIERYHIDKDQWEVIGHLPRNRSSNVVAQIGTKAYLIGGWDSTPKFKGDTAGRFHPEIDVFDLESETVTTLQARLPQPLRRALSAVVHEKKILLLGGIQEGASQVNLVDNMTSFDTETGNWQEWPALPFATFAPGAGILGDTIFLIGGMQIYPTGGFQYLNHLYRLDFDTRQWRHTGRSLSENKGFPQVVPFDGSLAILGGHSYQENTDSPVRTFEVLSENRPF